MKKIIRLTENDLTRIVRRVIKEQETAENNKLDVYGHNNQAYVQWDFPSLKTNPSVLYNLSIKCTKNCNKSVGQEDSDYSVDKKGITKNTFELGLGSSYNNIKYRNYLIKVDAIVNGNAVATVSKEYGKDTPSGSLTKFTG